MFSFNCYQVVNGYQLNTCGHNFVFTDYASMLDFLNEVLGKEDPTVYIYELGDKAGAKGDSKQLNLPLRGEEVCCDSAPVVSSTRPTYGDRW